MGWSGRLLYPAQSESSFPKLGENRGAPGQALGTSLETELEARHRGLQSKHASRPFGEVCVRTQAGMGRWFYLFFFFGTCKFFFVWLNPDDAL